MKELPKKDWPTVKIRLSPKDYEYLKNIAKEESRTIVGQGELFVRRCLVDRIIDNG